MVPAYKSHSLRKYFLPILMVFAYKGAKLITLIHLWGVLETKLALAVPPGYVLCYHVM